MKENPELFKNCSWQNADLCLKMVRRDGLLLEYVKKQNYIICNNAVKKNGDAIKFVHDEFQTKQIQITALSNKLGAIKYIKNPTEDVILGAFENILGRYKGITLQDIGIENQTKKICIKAVSKTNENIKYVDPKYYPDVLKVNGSCFDLIEKKYRTPELIRIAIKSYGNNIKLIDKKDQTPELALLAVKSKSEVLEYIRPDLQTEEMCYIALKESESQFKFIRKDLQNSKMVMMAIPYFTYSMKISEVREDLLTYDFYNKLIEHKSYNLRLIKKEDQTEELCYKAISNKPFTRIYMTYKNIGVWSERILKIAVKNTGSALELAPPELQTSEICYTAIEHCRISIEYVRPDLLTDEMKIFALKIDGMALGHIKNPSPIMCSIAVRNNPKAIKWVINDMKTQHMCDEAIKKVPELLEHVPSKYQTYEMCYCAIIEEKREKLIKYVKNYKVLEKLIEKDPDLICELTFPGPELCLIVAKKKPKKLAYIKKWDVDMTLAVVKYDGSLLKYGMITETTCQWALWHPGARKHATYSLEKPSIYYRWHYHDTFNRLAVMLFDELKYRPKDKWTKEHSCRKKLKDMKIVFS